MKNTTIHSLRSHLLLALLLSACGGADQPSSPEHSGSAAQLAQSAAASEAAPAAQAPAHTQPPVAEHGYGDDGGLSAEEQAVIGAPPRVPLAAYFARNPFLPHIRNKTLMLIGQEKTAIRDYVSQVGEPAGLMIYTGELGAGLTGPVGDASSSACSNSGVQDAQDMIGGPSPVLPHAIINIGMWIGGDQYDGNGTLVQPGFYRYFAEGWGDDYLRGYAEALRSAKRPILLRVGFEFDGPWNAYEPEHYKKAFRRIVSIFRGNTVNGVKIDPVQNVAFVWHSAASWMIDYSSTPISNWYPGDAYVDWVGISWLGGGLSNPYEPQTVPIRQHIAQFARSHRKALMIAESAPMDSSNVYGPDPNAITAATSWNHWFSGVADWISTHDVRVWSYINQNWRAFPMFAGQCGNGGDIWGDSRVQQAGSTVLEPWQQMLNGQSHGGRFKVNNARLWRDIGFFMH